MEEKKILKLLRVRKKHLNKKVSEEKLKIRYCRNFSSTKNELNYFVVNNNIAEISFPKEREEETGYIKEHSTDNQDRPSGARYFIKQGDVSYPRSGKVTPSYWNKLKRTPDYDKYFRRGHLIASTFGGDKKMSDKSNRGKKSQFIQTKWSNENDNGRNPCCQWRFEDIIKKTVKNCSVCIDSRPIYRNKADVIPIGVHLQAVTKERSLFNVFLPNIDPNILIDYKKCTFKPKK
ncbi:DNA-entry nuclease [Streptococcus sp. HMSC073D05]|uniref:DNA-entry nuclease n=1 Tax=Streptococcus TaxID=1301 RepID=UPI0008A2A68C|nr:MULTISPECIES: DNA-entry nuclease [Streptococcus]MCY7049363.1 DNA/RNA non-specific endonuclease [Streptococcus parasanguinis]OFK12474.1 DNA-entry nuclease [Streptococcus sp. HMSC073D05]